MKRILSLMMIICMIAITALAENYEISEYEYVNGTKCVKRQNVLTYLFMGIDDYGTVHERTGMNDVPGQCDSLYLLVIDKAADTYAVIPIDRNTVTPIHIISSYDGQDVGTIPLQIALAHTNGDGLQQSCEVTTTAVSDLLLGVNIDHYAAVNMDAIGIINDSVGGVTVTIEDDFSDVDPTLVQGETICLQGEQAEHFVRTRRGVGNGTNAERMHRQKQYLEGLQPLLEAKYAQDISFPLDLVHSLEDYMVTDMTDKDFSYIAKALTQNDYLGRFEITGKTEIDENNYEAFSPDEESIESTVLTLFYREIDEKSYDITMEEGTN